MAENDGLHKKNQLLALLKENWPRDNPNSLDEVLNSEYIPPLVIQTKMERKMGIKPVDQRKIHACYTACNKKENFNILLAQKISNFLTEDEAKVWKNLQTPISIDQKTPQIKN